jgi:23S rRNA (cytidine1920-2'-O)/16S rRNA (cytidine1409-2'-O)-methyltransferase
LSRGAGAGRRRADRLLHERGLAPSREKARALVLAGQVFSGERRVEKPGEALAEDAPLEVRGLSPYVSRGGHKLEHALDRFGVDARGRRCLDAGSSTGGFTDCLLQRGAAHVVAVDVGRGQLDWSLRSDSRVSLLERTNARDLAPEQVGEAPSLVTADLSFISLEKVLPALVRCAPDAELVVLVKPQIEAGRERVGKGGVVRDPAAWREVVTRVAGCLERLGRAVVGATASPLPGPAGNREFFLHARPAVGGAPSPAGLIEAAVAEAIAGEREGVGCPGEDA